MRNRSLKNALDDYDREPEKHGERPNVLAWLQMKKLKTGLCPTMI